MLNIGGHWLIFLQRHPDQIDRSIAGVAGFVSFAEWDRVHPAPGTVWGER